MQPTPSPKTPIRLELTIDEVSVLIAGLGKLPLEVSAELWIKVRQQAEGQLRPAAPGDEAPGLTD